MQVSYRREVYTLRRKVRATQSTILPNGKDLKYNASGTDSATENRLPLKYCTSGEKVKRRALLVRDNTYFGTWKVRAHRTVGDDGCMVNLMG